jgi:Leucine-rich repeat (LRR) protein
MPAPQRPAKAPQRPASPGGVPAPWSTGDGAGAGAGAGARSSTPGSQASRPRTPHDDTLAYKVEDERLERLAELQEARERAAAERDAEPATPHLYMWSAELVAGSLEQLGLPECAEYVRERGLDGRRFTLLEDSQVGALLEPIAKDGKKIKKVGAYFRGVRSEELANAPKLSALVTTKIDGSKRSCNLTLNEMKLTSFPDMICDIPQLVNVSAVHNRIRFVPSEIGVLTRLVNLKLGKNKLVELPESIGRCKALQMLMVEENDIKQLPRALGNCHALRVVDVSSNNLKMLPSTLSRCQKMVKLVAFDNPLKLPREVMDEGTKAVMSLLEVIGNAEEGGYLRMVNIKLQAVPQFTFDMTSLTMLNLDKNR